MSICDTCNYRWGNGYDAMRYCRAVCVHGLSQKRRERLKDKQKFLKDLGEVLRRHDVRIGWSHKRDCLEFMIGNNGLYIIAPINADDCERMVNAWREGRINSNHCPTVAELVDATRVPPRAG